MCILKRNKFNNNAEMSTLGGKYESKTKKGHTNIISACNAFSNRHNNRYSML